MLPGSTAGALMALLAANGTSVLDCVCNHIKVRYDANGFYGFSYGDQLLFWSYCINFRYYWLVERCDALEPPSVMAPAVVRLLPNSRGRGGWEGEAEAGGRCGGGLAGVRGLSAGSRRGLDAWDMVHLIANDSARSCSPQGLDDVEWNQETLSTDHVRRPILSRLLNGFQCITKAIAIRNRCAWREKFGQSLPLRFVNNNAVDISGYLQHFSKFWRDSALQLSLGVSHLSKLFIPLAFEHMGIHPNDQRLHEWIENAERVRDMLHSKLRALVYDVQYVADQTAYYKIELYNNETGVYDLRRSFLNEGLLLYHQRFLSFHDHYSAVCEAAEPRAAQMFALADALYSFHRLVWVQDLPYPPAAATPVYDEWQLEDRSNVTLSVDTECLQLLAGALEQPSCPLEAMPLEELERRRRCRLQLWRDMEQRSPHVPVTSYLAYSQRANVNLCLLAWMAANSFSICQDVPFSMLQSVHDARCYSDSPEDQSCLQSNTTDAICSVSRAILLLKCRDFSAYTPPEICGVNLYTNGSYSAPFKVKGQGSVKGYVKPTDRTLNYKDTLNTATLKYKDFKVDSLKPLEISFIALNIFFRFITAVIYLYLPLLNNLPGKILLSFQITGLVQILCSEIMYRMRGVPDLPTAVFIDSSLTLLSCICLNVFCYQMYGYVRHLRLPNDLQPAEASSVFRRQAVCALIPWGIVCASCFVLEKSGNYYLLYSRVLFLSGISVSVAFNLICLGLVGYMYLRTRNSMQELRIYSNGKFASKKQLVFMSVKTIVLSGIGIMIRIGFHQAQGISQFVYYVHVTTMLQGPVLFVLFVCNGTTVAALRTRVLDWWTPDVIRPDQELCSAAERNLARRRNEQDLAVETAL